MLRTIKALNQERGVTVVLITHHMDEAAQADRLVVMSKGRVVADGVPKEVFSHVEELKAVGLTVPRPPSFSGSCGRRESASLWTPSQTRSVPRPCGPVLS